MLWLRNFVSVVAIFVVLQAAYAREEILSFDSDIRIEIDSSMTVTESIRVVAEGDQIRRGIYREFPTDYRDRLNNRIQVGFEVDSVTRDGISEPFFSEKYANGVRVYIGDKDKYLPVGEYEYTISYRTNRQLGYFADHDELYWNVTGNGWGLPIKKATATIRLPAGVSRATMAVEGYTGPFGSQGQNYSARIPVDSEAYIETRGPLRPNEGLTVVVIWPKGVVVEPTMLDRLVYLLADNRALLIELAGTLLLLLYLYLVWSRYGRDPEPGPVFPHYEPPAKLSPGACRYIERMAHDHQCFSAAVLNLAVKGYITIHEGRTEAMQAATDGSFYDKAVDKLSPLQKDLLGPLLKLAENALDAALDDTFVLEQMGGMATLPPLGPGEKALLEKLFSTGKYLVLTNSNHQVIGAAIRAHEQALEKYYKRENFLTNAGYIFPAVLISAATAVLAISNAALTPLAIIVLIAQVMITVAFIYLMKAPTPQGRKTKDRIAGFRMYLAVAEAEDLQRIEGIAGRSPVKTPELFEELLPFAVALDVEQPWADQFERLFMRISAEEGKSYRPGWYRGRKPVHSFSGFTTELTSSLGAAISSSSAAPGSSSGGGGGGSSGGGGGGGGGGGW